jgi:Uma2 family endonuclease
MAADAIELWRPDLDTYHRLIEAGAFENLRVELLDGVIAQMSPKGREHEQALTFLNRTIVECVPAPMAVRIQCALSLGEGWEPEPDIAVVDPNESRPYHPSRAMLVCEVAMTSLRRDRTVKRDAYARFGIPEYWIVAIPDRRIEIHRTPGPKGYSDVAIATGGTLASSALPTLIVDVDALLAEAFR